MAFIHPPLAKGDTGNFGKGRDLFRWRFSGNSVVFAIFCKSPATGKKTFIKAIGVEGNKQLRFFICYEKGKVTEFAVQLEVLEHGKWMPVVRYDTSHGAPHRDTLDRRGNLLEKKFLKLGTLNEVLEYAEQDLLDRVDCISKNF